jgi:hypothetical protein
VAVALCFPVFHHIHPYVFRSHRIFPGEAAVHFAPLREGHWRILVLRFSLLLNQLEIIGGFRSHPSTFSLFVEVIGGFWSSFLDLRLFRRAPNSITGHSSSTNFIICPGSDFFDHRFFGKALGYSIYQVSVSCRTIGGV